MNHVIKQFNISNEAEYEAYQKMLDDAFISILSEASEFSKDGNYFILVHGVESEEPILEKREQNHVDILNMSLPADRFMFSQIYNQYEVKKEVLNFNRKVSSFQIALHWVDRDKNNVNMKFYRTEETNVQ